LIIFSIILNENPSSLAEKTSQYHFIRAILLQLGGGGGGSCLADVWMLQ